MITVLWVMTVAGIVATAGALSGRNAVNAAANRTHFTRAFWTAAGCVARAEWAIDTVLASSKTFEDAADVWRVLSTAVLPIPEVDHTECSVELEAAGTRIDVNAASEELLRNLFTAVGFGGSADGLASSIADWRDTDDVAHPDGAEREWYAGAHRALPRNARIADLRELHRVRGLENISGLDSILSVEQGRISLATAPTSVLLAVPGFTRETAEHIVAMQRAGTPVTDITALLGIVSRPSADSLLARYPDIVRATTPNPDAWILTVHATVGTPPVTVTLARRLLRAGKRAVVVSSRSDL